MDSQTQQRYKTSTEVIFKPERSLLLRAHTGLSVMGGVGAYSSRKGLAPWRGQCHQPGVGLPPLRLAGKMDGIWICGYSNHFKFGHFLREMVSIFPYLL